MQVWKNLEATGGGRTLVITEPCIGLRAILVIDDTTLGPAAGGIRTHAYHSFEEALGDAQSLARAMTYKCALAGLKAGGGKMVVLEPEPGHRAQVFRRIGEVIEELGGLFRTAGDVGTTVADLEEVAKTTQFVHSNSEEMEDAVAAGVMRCMNACIDHHGGSGLAGLRVAVQGCGKVGGAVINKLACAGAELWIADNDLSLVRGLADRYQCNLSTPGNILFEDVDILAPCATGGVLNHHVVNDVRAWAVCGAANNALVDTEVASLLQLRRIQWVPDLLASAGSVIYGIGRSVMGLDDTDSLLEDLGLRVTDILERSEKTGVSTELVATAMAREILRQMD
ncbi:MAG: Glu/Leu/Phe/Val dehydrogenase dimerization domain-containing protein [Myxococcota bacterium]|nr:Glu/Leu/Phe/Val dehydrogenase dimerization domain-containing protein [Myxococcota bacterium]